MSDQKMGNPPRLGRLGLPAEFGATERDFGTHRSMDRGSAFAVVHQCRPSVGPKSSNASFVVHC